MNSSPIMEWMFSQEIMKNALLLFFPWLLATWNHYRWTHLFVTYTMWVTPYTWMPRVLFFFFFFHAFPVTPKECCIMPLYSQEWGEKTPLPGAKYCFVVRYVKFWLMEMQNYWLENRADKNKPMSIHAFQFMEISSSLQDILCSLSEF